MGQNDTGKSMPHQLIMQDRQMVEMTGVSDVDSFDEVTITAYTSLGALTVDGSGLRVKRLDLECGILTVEGKIDALRYTEAHKRGFFGKLLR